jgi:hypothetical protein
MALFKKQRNYVLRILNCSAGTKDKRVFSPNGAALL